MGASTTNTPQPVISGRPPTERAVIWRPAGFAGVEALAARYTRQEFLPHRHDAFLIGIIEQGVHSVWCRGTRTAAGPGFVATFDPGEVHHGGAADPQGWQQRMLYVAEDVVAEVLEDLLDRAAPAPALHFRDCFRRDVRSANAIRRVHELLQRDDRDVLERRRGDSLPGAESMKNLIALTLILASGCAHKMADLKKPDRVQRFTLAKDYTRTEVRGLGYKWVEGLRAGEYVLAAEDDEGLYFMGKGRCVIKLMEKFADEYLKTGDAKVSPSQSMGGSVGFFTGGLWLPKKGVDAKPKLFFELDTSDPSSQSQGAVVSAIIASGTGDVLFISYDSEKTFVDELKISD